MAKLDEQRQTSVFTLKNFEQHRIDNSSVFSTPFYTDISCASKFVQTVMATSKVLSHVAVFAYIMCGVTDNHFSWPFTGRVNVELLNQLDDAIKKTRTNLAIHKELQYSAIFAEVFGASLVFIAHCSE